MPYLFYHSKYREIEMDGIKIDFYDPAGKIIHETKKSILQLNSLC